MAWIAKTFLATTNGGNPYTDWAPEFRDKHDVDTRAKISRSVKSPVTERFPRLPKAEQPDALILHAKYKLWSMFQVHGGMRVVQRDLKELIERFDPGLHEFWPVSLRYDNGKPEPLECYGFRPGLALDTVVLEESDLEQHPEAMNPCYLTGSKSSVENKFCVTIAKSFRAGNIWMEPITTPHLMLSDELVAEMKSKKLKFFKMDKVKEI